MIDSSRQEAPLGHGQTLRGLWDAARSERLPHALLFHGPEGIGKYRAARWFAQGLLCEQGPGEPCLICGSCRRVSANSHPDMFLVDPAAEGQDSMTVHFIANRKDKPKTAYQGPSIEDFGRLVADEGGWRIACLREVDSMNDSAQNAFLKALEEPGDDMLLLLTTAKPDVLRQTIRSRTISVDLHSLTQAETLTVLKSIAGEAPGLDSAMSREALARWSQGAPGKAMTLARRAGLPMRDIVQAVAAGSLDPQEAGERFWDLEGEFPGKTPAAERRTQAVALMDVALEWLLDGLRQAALVPSPSLAHGDALEALEDVSPNDMNDCMDRILQARQDVALNLNPEVLSERVLRSLNALSNQAAAQGAGL